MPRGRIEGDGVVAGFDGQRVRGVLSGGETVLERVGKGESDGLGILRCRVANNVYGEARVFLRRPRQNGHG